MERKTKIEPPAKQIYSVAVEAWGAKTPAPWVKTKAKTVEGAKRLAAKLNRGLTAIVSVAVETERGELRTIATLSDSSAITRRRPVWRTHKLTTGQASA